MLTSSRATRAAGLTLVGGALASLLGCSSVGGSTSSERLTAASSEAAPDESASPCVTYAARTVAGRGGPYPRGRTPPFALLPEPFHQGGTQWDTIDVSPAQPVTFGVKLGHDEGFFVSSLTFVVKPYGYRGDDGGLTGAVFNRTFRNLRPEGQTLTATFDGRTPDGAPLAPGKYKVMFEAIGHRTSPSTCTASGPVEPADQNDSASGAIFGLARVSEP